MKLVSLFLILMSVQSIIYVGTNEIKTNYGNDVQTAVFALSNHFPEIFFQKRRLFQVNDCTKVFINPENKSSEVPLIHSMHEALTLIFSDQIAIRSTFLRLKHSSHCSMVVYLTSAVSSAEIYGDDLIEHFPGDTVFSFHFLIENTLPNERFWNLPFVRRISNVLVLVPAVPVTRENDSKESGTIIWNIFTPTRYGSTKSYLNIGEVSSTHLKVGNQSHDKIIGSDIFWNKWKDLNGDPIRMGAPPLVNEALVRLYREKRRHEFMTVLMSEVSDMLNATPKMVANDITFGNGYRLDNGTWTSYIGKILSDTIDICVPFVPFSYQYKVLGMSKGVIHTPIKFFTPLPKKMDMSLKFLIEPFDESIWVAIFVCILANVITIYFLMRSTNQLPGKLVDRMYFFVAKIIDFSRVLIDQPIPDDVLAYSGYASTGPRVIFLVWLLVMIVVGNLYKSVVISILVQPVYVNPPLTISELVRSNFQVNFLFYKAFKFDTRLPWVNDLKYPVIDSKMNFAECLQSILKGPNVCIFVHNYLYVYAPKYLVDASGKVLFLESKDAMYATTSFMGISRLNPQLNEAVDRVVEVIIEGALDIIWVKSQFYENSLRTIHRKKKTVASEEILEDSLVDKDLMLYPILILIAGLVIALVCFGVELLWVKWFKFNESVSSKLSNMNNMRRVCNDCLSSYESAHPTPMKAIFDSPRYNKSFPKLIMVERRSTMIC